MLRAGFRKCSSLRVLVAPTSHRQFSAHTGSFLDLRQTRGEGSSDHRRSKWHRKRDSNKFINNGAKVVLADIQKDQGQQTARELGPNAAFIQCDVTRESDVSQAVDFTVSKHGQLDIMYNNAGIACHTPPSVIDLDLSTFDRVMAINVRGVLAGLKHAARVMIPRQRGVIGIVKSAASELCSHGIRINCISPMAIPTPFVMEELKKYYPGVDAQKLVKMVHGFSVLRGAFVNRAT
ncbi:UNVERIFIED_CONTAM: Zerumbone synthase [Sesamum latifolium]|uniref:Zerumbone synthase n=1 Tax=Sesamum latifolium TaxID=2727402 RepID=A0AAW2Y1K2_9LAMI